jgi:SAM-dependent methyltransferase
MDAVDKGIFSEYARYYNLLYGDKDYAGETDYISRLIHRFMPNAKSLLELGSGTGKHAILLTEHGYQVRGVERSEQMLAPARDLAAQEKARLKERSPLFEKGDIRSIRLNETFDVATALFHVISYQTTNEDLLDAFRTARVHLKEHGLFIFDVWYGPTVLTDRPLVRVKRVSDDALEVTRIAEPVMHAQENVVDVNYHIFIKNKATGQVSETNETHRMRYLFSPEIEVLLEQADFKLLHSEQWMSGRQPGFDTWGVCFIASAK